ncbi:MAG: Xylose operon regulatory protein [Verrucomicrobiales bacterium]|nr:Xylose operon regulatory protein [Verrucomicrobiales bacterium]
MSLRPQMTSIASLPSLEVSPKSRYKLPVPPNARKKSPHVAVCVDTARSHGRGVLAGIAEYVETFGPWSMFIDFQAESDCRQGRSKDWHGDGILTYIEGADRAQRLRRSRIPTVELFPYRDDQKLPQVVSDDVAIGRMAAEHLVERQFKNFAFSGYPEALWSSRRQKGFSQSLLQSGFVVPMVLNIKRPKTLNNWESMQQQLSDWIRKLPKPVAVMACSDRHAQRILDACHRAGFIVPDDIAVIGVDNDEETCRLSNPPLSSVMDNARKVGYEGARILDQLMSGKLKAKDVPPILIPPVGIATRRSTDVAAIDDRLVASAVALIRENACNGLEIPHLLKRLGISRSVFYLRFQSALGRSPHHEILRVQLERVRSLLTQTSLSLEEISQLAGFQNPDYLSVAFKRELGQTPGDYRKQNRRT